MDSFKIFILIILLITKVDSQKLKPILKFRNDGTFKIVQFTDMHYGHGDQKDFDTQTNQEKVIDAEKPDFVMFSGDMISGYLSRFYINENQYDYYWSMFTSPLIKRGIPWAITMGNHDSQGPINANGLIEKDQKYELSLTGSDGTDSIHGAANYFINIYSPNYNNETTNYPLTDRKKYIASHIYVFDSDTIECNKLDWGCIHNDQINWFKNASESNKKRNSVSFIHIPPIEIIDLWNHNDNVYGDFNEKPCCFNNKKSRFVDALVESGDIRGLYYGHDHQNDFHGIFKGSIQLGYGRKSGAGSYSSGKPLGARVIQLTLNPFTVDTWIREANGNKIIQEKPIGKKHHYAYRCSLKDQFNTGQIVMIITLSVTGLIIAIILSVLAYLMFKKCKNRPYGGDEEEKKKEEDIKYRIRNENVGNASM